ncbi:MAG: hypothetical protein ACRDYU_01050 [Actinomycetes bacterium]
MSLSTLDLAQTVPASSVSTARRVVILLVALGVALSGLTVLNTSSADASTPPYPSYQPQTRCSPSAKAGTVFLANWLQRRYGGSGSLGISRPCGSGGASEHKEGRAFDWGLDATRDRDRGYARAFRHYLFNEGRSGLNHARARRMGVMYLIWNDRIYSSSYRYRSRPYTHYVCSSIRGCSKTLRHRDHMHISLTRGGGAGNTLWFRHHMR